MEKREQREKVEGRRGRERRRERMRKETEIGGRSVAVQETLQNEGRGLHSCSYFFHRLLRHHAMVLITVFTGTWTKKPSLDPMQLCCLVSFV